MNAQDLKNSILQLAVQGKLVEQRPEEGTAEKLYEQIVAEKAQLIKDGKVQKKKDTQPFYDNDELSEFNIPDSWKWVKLSDVSLIQEGAGIRKWQYRDMGTRILCVTNILEGSIDLDKKNLFISDEEYHEKYEHLTLNIGDIVTACSGGSWGKTAIFDSTRTMMLNTSTLRLRFYGDLAYNKYLYYITKSVFFRRQLELQLSGMQPNFGYAHYSRVMFPLPPLEEQHRIVAKIEEILPYIDQYDKAYTKLETFNKKFPEDMKKSILQMAMQGKLVEQRPEEGTADELYEQIIAEKAQLIKDGKIKKEKPLPEIAEDEIPFQIPSSWKWVRFSEVMDVRDGTHDSPKYKETGIPLVTSKNISGGGLNFSNVKYISREDADKINERSKVDTGDILFAMIGSIGNPVIVNKDREFCVKNVALFKNYDKSKMCIEYVYWFLYREQYIMKKVASGGVQSFISLKVFRNYLFPLPPLEEQKRIVAKIEELLPYCNKLIK